MYSFIQEEENKQSFKKIRIGFWKQLMTKSWDKQTHSLQTDAQTHTHTEQGRVISKGSWPVTGQESVSHGCLRKGKKEAVVLVSVTLNKFTMIWRNCGILVAVSFLYEVQLPNAINCSL